LIFIFIFAVFVKIGHIAESYEQAGTFYPEIGIKNGLKKLFSSTVVNFV